MEDCYHYKELIKHVNYSSLYKPVIINKDGEYYLLDVLNFNPDTMKVFKIDMSKFELIEGSKEIIHLAYVNEKKFEYLNIDKLYQIYLQQQRKYKILSIYE
jgi:hypothetical protein